MALSIKNPEVDRLLAEIVRATGETKTEAIRKALEERRTRITLQEPGSREVRIRHGLAAIRSAIPPRAKGRPLSREEEDRILGYGPEGV